MRVRRILVWLGAAALGAAMAQAQPAPYAGPLFEQVVGKQTAFFKKNL